MQETDESCGDEHGDANTAPPDAEPLDVVFSRAMTGGDFDVVCDLVRRSWFDLLRDHSELVREKIGAVPASQLREYPLLAMLLGVCLGTVGHARVRGLRYFGLAVMAARGKRSGLSAVDRSLILASESAAYRLIGQPAMGVSPARAAVRALDSLSVAEREGVGDVPRIYAQAGISLYYGGQIEDASAAFAAGLIESPRGRSSGGFSNVSMLAGIIAERGDIPEARVHIELARQEPWTDEQRSMYTGVFYRIAEAVTALERFDAPTAQNHLAAMVYVPRTIEHWLTIARTEAMTALVAGRPGDGLSHLDAFAVMRGAEGRSTRVRAALGPTRALLQLALGNPDAASVILRRDVPASTHAHVHRARLQLVLGRNGGALHEVRAIAGVEQSTRTLAEATAIEAAALLRFSTSARMRAAVEHLGAVLTESEQLLALGLLPVEDFDRVRAALCDAGFSALFDSVAVRALLPGLETDPLLSERELAVLEALMRTGSASLIARELLVSVNTVKTQLRSVYRKLQVSSRDEAIAVALDRHLLVNDDE